MLAALKEKLNELVARMLPNGRTAQLQPVLALFDLRTLRSNRTRPFYSHIYVSAMCNDGPSRFFAVEHITS